MSGTSEKKAAAVPSSPPASPAGEMPEVADSRWLVPGVCIFLAAIIWVVFGQTLGHEFVNYDDQAYVYENPVVTHGLDLRGVEWAFTHTVVANWHPLTVMSHMLDCRLYGLNPGGHHLTNVLLHTATAILLFLVLRQMTGFLWRSAFVAAVFAIHPLRVESVAWVAERKDVLSGLFFMLTLWAWVRFVEESKTQSSKSKVFFGLSLLMFALGLMSKPMLVTLPFLLLLLDYWPLGRVAGGEWQVTGEKTGKPSTLNPQLSTLLLEKLPLLGLAVASCAVTIFAQTKAILPLEYMSLSLRLGNAAISCVAYMGQMFWPSGLAVLYPFTAGRVGVSEVVVSLGLLAGISGGVIILCRRRPYFLTGWLWYLIMLGPVIGILQVGSQARADRYTYLPQIGLYVLLAWAAADLCAGWRHRRVVLGGGATVILVALILCARAQTSYWRNSELLWTHTLACTSDNAVAHDSLGNTLLQQGKVDEAIAQYQKALQIKPNYAVAHYNLGNVLLQEGKVEEAITHCQRALQIKPNYAEAHYNLGSALLQKGKVDEAITQYQQALQVKPDFAEAHNDLGSALLQEGKVDEAITHYQKALQIKPDFAKAHNNLGNALLQEGRVYEAIVQYQQALQIKPDYAEAHYNLGNALIQKGKVDEAVAQYQQALQIKPDYAEAHNNLGYVLLQQGNAAEAVTHFQKALQIKPDYAEAHYNFGNALLQKGQVDEAIAQYQKALQIRPDSAEAHNKLCYALLQKGRVDEAIAQYQKGLKFGPDNAKAYYNFGNALLQRGRVNEAIAQYQQALQIKPDSLGVLNNLAWLLATCPDAHIRDGVQAVKYAGHACELTHYGVAPLVGTLAAAYAEAGRFDDAIMAAEKACALATAADERDLLEKNRKLLVLYRAHQPYHEAVEKIVPAAP